MSNRRWVVGAAVAVATMAFAAADAGAQGLDAFAARIRAKVAAGDRVTVVSAAGVRSSGLLVDVSGRSMRLRDERGLREIALQEVTEVEKRGDSPWNGLLIGLTLGALVGFGTYTECEPDPPFHPCEGNLTMSRGMETLAAAALLGSIGLAVDALMDRSTTVHGPPAARPTTPRRGVNVSVSPSRMQASFRVRF